MSEGKRDIFATLKHLVVDDEDQKPGTVTVKPGIPSVRPSAPVAAASPVLTAPVAMPTFAAPVQSDTADAETLTLFQNAVMTPTVNGHPSQFMKFFAMWTALNKPADATTVIGALNVSDPGITLEAVVTDYQAHMAQLDTVSAQADAELAQAGDADLKVIHDAADALRAQNDAAQAEITRHQTETADRNAKLAELTTQEANAKNTTSQAQQRAVVAQNTVRGTLISFKNILKV